MLQLLEWITVVYNPYKGIVTFLFCHSADIVF